MRTEATTYEIALYRILESAGIDSKIFLPNKIDVKVVMLPGSYELLSSGVSIWWEVTLDDNYLLRFRDSFLMEIEVKSRFIYLANQHQKGELFDTMDDLQESMLTSLNGIQFFEREAVKIVVGLHNHLLRYLKVKDTKVKRRNSPFQMRITRASCGCGEHTSPFTLSTTAKCVECS